ncbi:MAG TPA: AtpZ/AtpI family protein [Edaphobacter sp.]
MAEVRLRKPVRDVMVFAMAEDGKKGGALGELVKAESMIQLAIALPAGCVIGWLIGTWLDRHFHQNWMGIVGIIMGAAGGFIQIFLTASRYLRRGK